jgi:DeoR/GlpR family transcriptional regulator of sugar metabolism
MAITPDAEPPLAVRAQVRLAEKTRIARAAARLINPGQTLLLDAGSTMSVLARELATLSGRTIVTNSFEVATTIGSGLPRMNKVLVLGGELGDTMPATYGTAAVSDVLRWQADIALLSPVGIDAHHGATSFDLAEADLARAMASAAKRVFILADHAKIGLTSRVGFCPVGRIDTLITDARAEGSPGLAALRSEIETVIVA